MAEVATPGADLYWIPLGAGGNFVRLNGRAYEAVAAALQRRPRCDLYHSALQVFLPEGRYVIEMTPVRESDGPERGVVAEGPVGARWAGRFKLFRYELRVWLEGVIPDLAEAVERIRLTDDPVVARHLVEVASEVPDLVWGRDELHAGEMWNSNSMVAWMIDRVGLDAASLEPPPRGRAPGWSAGLLAGRRQAADYGPASSPLRSSAR